MGFFIATYSAICVVSYLKSCFNPVIQRLIQLSGGFSFVLDRFPSRRPGFLHLLRRSLRCRKLPARDEIGNAVCLREASAAFIASSTSTKTPHRKNTCARSASHRGGHGLARLECMVSVASSSAARADFRALSCCCSAWLSPPRCLW